MSEMGSDAAAGMARIRLLLVGFTLRALIESQLHLFFPSHLHHPPSNLRSLLESLETLWTHHRPAFVSTIFLVSRFSPRIQ